MRLLLLLIVVVNLGLLAYGQGYFGVPPGEVGRTLIQRPPISTHLITVGEPVLNPHTAR